MEKKMVEEWLPLSEMNLNASKEMSFIRVPKISNFHPWSARRPTSTARIITLASLVPYSDELKAIFPEIVGLNECKSVPYQIIYLIDPKREIIERKLREIFLDPTSITVVDPMAGGGSIPLEMLRLGLKTIAMDYNPVAYLILKATLEYPAKYGKTLYEVVKHEANALIKWAKKELARYYPPDCLNIIFARGFRCVECGGLVPIIHGTKLGKKGPYIDIKFNREKKSFKVRLTEEEPSFERLICPYCSRPFTHDEVFKWWVSKHKQLLEYALKGDVNKTKTSTKKLLEVHIPLIKQIKKSFVSCEQEDYASLTKAYLDLASQIEDFKEYLPNSSIPNENDVFKPIVEYGIEKWYELFNPRQLFNLLNLAKYVAERVKVNIEEKGEDGAAVGVILALGLSKILNFNNITTTWDSSTKTVRELLDHYARTRKVGLGLEYCEAKRIDLALDWVYEPSIENPTATHGGICPVIKLLCQWLEGLADRIRIYMGDARELSEILGKGTVDVVNVDPPYLDQHTYSDLSEFFWQILRLTLKRPIEKGYLFNMDEERGTVECLVSGWNPLLPTVPREGEIIVRKSVRELKFRKVPYSKNWYKEAMFNFFHEANKSLKDEGVLVVWYTHTNPEAWEAVLSGLYASDFNISKVWTIRTEMGERRVAQKGLAFFTSLALIARKGDEGVVVGEEKAEKLLSNFQIREIIRKSVLDALDSAKVSGASKLESYIMALAGAIAGATRIRNPSLEKIVERSLNNFAESTDSLSIKMKTYGRLSGFFRESIYPVALYVGADILLEEELMRTGMSKEDVSLIASIDDRSRAYLIIWLSTRFTESVDFDFTEKICKVLGFNVSGLESLGLIRRQNSGFIPTYGRDTIESLKGKLELLDRTVAGKAIRLTKHIVESTIKDDVDRCARKISESIPVGKFESTLALFLLKTAKEGELEKASIFKYSISFVEKVLEKVKGA